MWLQVKPSSGILIPSVLVSPARDRYPLSEDKHCWAEVPRLSPLFVRRAGPRLCESSMPARSATKRGNRRMPTFLRGRGHALLEADRSEP